MGQKVFVPLTIPQTSRDHLPQAPVIHRFQRGDEVVHYNAFTHNHLLRKAADPEPTQAELDSLSEVDWSFTPMDMLSDPHLMRVEVTQTCNFQCSYCIVFENNLAQLYEHMSADTARNLLQWYRDNMMGGTVMLIGGEPTLNWDVCKIFLEGVPLDAGKELYTNGILLSDKDIAWLRDLNVEIRLSLDGFERHHRQRVNFAGETLYAQVLDRLAAMQRLGANVGVNCTVTPNNLPDLVDIHHYFVQELGIRHVNYSIPHTTVNSTVADGLDMNAYTAALMEIYEDAKRNHVYVAQIMKRVAYIARKRFKAIGCTVIGPEVTFYPNGKRTLCTKLDSHPKTRVVTPQDIYDSLPFFQQDCRSCSAIGICGGGCYWDAQMRFDRFQDLRECDFQRQLLERMLWDVVDWTRSGDEFPVMLNDVFGTTMFGQRNAA
ncbi:radical SAM protein [Plantactinospora sp. S1510]|uniref:Radical SAM protein n=1 Tax=Plantactinospora alkalitolerans TaxID=2789879 RepID=A0ABS0GQU9_9ACTN|nr:radical SAM protein [Plantactinospora alkalitolerans]MBF9128535.1 radical SAM protein [Plantactinospora alkalitolerans]